MKRKKRNPILYLGDGRLDGAAAYLAGALHLSGRAFDHLPSDAAIPSTEDFLGRQLVILSDFPSKNMGRRSEALVAAVGGGCGLLMIGGWASFHGLNGFWDQSPVARVLPVQIAAHDDRVHCDQPAFLRRRPGVSHPVLRGLPWDLRPPCVGGFNRARPAPGAQVVLEAVRCRARFVSGRLSAQERSAGPLLSFGQYKAGRTAAFMSDAAPHWAGLFIDWGPRRVRVQAPGARAVEVGVHYARFFVQLTDWLSHPV